MDNDGFVTLIPQLGRQPDTTVRVEKNNSYLSRDLWRKIGAPSRIDVQVNRTTGWVRIVPGNETGINPNGQFGTILGTFCRHNGFAFGKYKAEVVNGAVTFGLNREGGTL
jgi:hypothetical protein